MIPIKKSDKNKVYEAYDEIIEWFDSHRTKDLTMERFYLEFIEEHMPKNGDLLDVGCGTGEPIAKYFIEKFYKVTGVDASTKMLSLCKKRFPQSRWILADMRTLALSEKFDTVIAWHSLFHLPQGDQRKTLKLLANLVKPNGLLIFTSGVENGEEWGENGGYDLYHASLSSDEYKKILEDQHLKILIHKIKDPRCGEATIWIAQKIEIKDAGAASIPPF